ncbi:MAG TPA: hypothetical protein VN256_27430 [Pyrinomonadaceae bacterium]|nr:hypothetical protein [Pyrinomonadaceae bacterium]
MRTVTNKERVVGEAKGAVPGYIRIGICKECGAGVYAPEAAAAAGEFKRMSACACAGGPKAGADGQRPEPARPGKRVSGTGRKAA